MTPEIKKKDWKAVENSIVSLFFYKINKLIEENFHQNFNVLFQNLQIKSEQILLKSFFVKQRSFRKRGRDFIFFIFKSSYDCILILSK